jgi:transglutaminase-like putative cysteine protease
VTAGPRGRGPRSYEVRHRTRYRYDDEVTSSYGRAYLVPRDAPGQHCPEHRLEVTPQPLFSSESLDLYGNRSVYFEVHTAHDVLDVLAVSRVDVTRQPPDLTVLDGLSWERAAAAVATGPTAVEACELLLPSPKAGAEPEVAAYAATVFEPGRPVGEALTALVSRIHADFAYRSGATSVSTTLAEVLRRREGVCQDFAHVAVAALRSVGIPARYVSGYLETDPPPGRPRLQGADASHAWVSALLPELGWVDVDPTNDQPADARYVVTAWGRDYADVPPLRGVIFTESTTSTLDVEVDVLRVEPAASG